MGMFRDTQFAPKKVKTHRASNSWCTKIFHGIVWNNGRLNTVSFQTFFAMIKKVKVLQTDLGKLIGNNVANLEDHGCPKNQDLVLG